MTERVVDYVSTDIDEFIERVRTIKATSDRLKDEVFDGVVPNTPPTEFVGHSAARNYD